MGVQVDPDGDQIEALAWWDPDQLADNPAVRPELVESLDDVLAALGRQVVKAGDAGPKAPDSAKHWPGWDRDLDTVAVWVPRIRQAMKRAVDVRRLASAWLSQVRKASNEADQARSWLDGQGIDLAGALTFIQMIQTEGYAIGEQSAQAMLTGSGSVDWSAWTPGDADAARLVLGADGEAGLAELLDEADVSISSIAANRLDQLAGALADALATGESVESLADRLAGILDDPQWADLVATTEISRAVSAASMDTYAANGIAATEWLSAEDGRVCVTCSLNAGAGAVPLGTPFPSGDFQPPGHPACRCAPSPVVGG